MSALLMQAIARGKVSVRKNRRISGEVAIHFMDPGLAPIHIRGTEVVELTLIPGVDGLALQRSNLRKLVPGILEIL